jgi:diguanylate cyclase (GGDEF)-like protein
MRSQRKGPEELWRSYKKAERRAREWGTIFAKNKEDAAQGKLTPRELREVERAYWAALKEAAFYRRGVAKRLSRDAKFAQIRNIASFNENVLASLENPEFRRGQYSFATIDLDDLKKLNTKYGYKVGDIVIGALADTLANFAAQHHGFACRFGGEEFKLFAAMGETELAKHLRRLQNEFGQRLANPQRVAAASTAKGLVWKPPTFSAGVCGKKTGGLSRLRDPAPILAKLATHSNKALDSAKAAKNSVRIFNPKARPKAMRLVT